jgi:hypothetical protein
MRAFVVSGLALVVAAFLACSEDVGHKTTAAPTGSDAGADSGTADFDNGTELDVPVPDGQRVYVSLATPAIATPADPKTDKSWDLAFEGYDVFTNSGPSGSGASSAFGPLDTITFIDNTAPDVPFLTSDQTGGAFIRWWFYSGAPDHVLYSRFHRYGVKDGAKLYRVQVEGYYGQRDGTAVPALYKIRYAEVGQPSKELDLIDGTGTDANAPNDCLDLGTGVKVSHTPAQALTAMDWHLCFRRENISVNGESGGPRGVTAVDLDAAQTATETLSAVEALTPDSQAAAFNGLTAASFDGQTFRGDRVISAFDPLWLAKGANPPAPAQSAWLVVGADGKKRYLVGFPKFNGATATTPGTVVMRVKVVQ